MGSEVPQLVLEALAALAAATVQVRDEPAAGQQRGPDEAASAEVKKESDKRKAVTKEAECGGTKEVEGGGKETDGSRGKEGDGIQVKIRHTITGRGVSTMAPEKMVFCGVLDSIPAGGLCGGVFRLFS